MNDEQTRERRVKLLIWAIIIFGLLAALGSQSEDSKRSQLEQNVPSCMAAHKQTSSLITVDECAALDANIKRLKARGED